MTEEKKAASFEAGEDFASAIRTAETAISKTKAAEAGRPVPAARGGLIKNVFYIALLLACAVVFYRGFPELAAASFSQKPLRTGPYGTDAKTDACIANLWELAAAMRAGSKLPQRVCPASGKPYSVEKGVVSCPTPGLHGAARLYADSRTVMPVYEK